MRLWHLFVLVAATAIVMTLWKGTIGRIGVIVFFFGLIEVILAVSAVMALFQTIGHFGAARTPGDSLMALIATGVVLVGGSSLMWLVALVGVQVFQLAVPVP
ncbi:hypothetical protein Isop_1089 [Isosphaera pallida ATCC 43644]|jgi:hypothetical protein|uniref:Uncharacterized protein n=1 Tax=Isosphaera pallida (strain ATCC 43644 / DSM 9630 / IS1B) TaxID=575540 RepID=E8R4T1_ISOPI|nr:hypothetical protein [Isosphaera pallida]ADV61677.1 hypothetical protein Isop_1089 [Isosphaera pallida ATCC 43644]